jgi:tetratricopeptide (TPR) repeat protein
VFENHYSLSYFPKKSSEEYYYEAMLVYNEARKTEPENPWLLFDLSEVYARTNHLETATALLDTAIMLNGTVAAFYSNRGLLHYKLKENSQAINDYLTAARIDSVNPHIYLNLALVYYYENEFDLVCESIAKAERLGGSVHADKFLSMIKKKYCDTE